ncbi:hypothetical protein [Marinobacter sp. CHS3-4]|uniref:hypothetical protein n=1 Tax=Marinobacter sp. CHS3-4 TaxID=3045174 RepID=UPI0024B4B334|nr:hypothetical protein [Marinobacter sp. CHS3-4]MDI9246614.1 hypothetical protein [Marinobacter sp. CHS3-4]
MNTVLCMKWGAKYGPEYVNRLASMVRRNLSVEYRFVCLTDDSLGIDPGVEVQPIPDGLVAIDGPERGWKKLLAFAVSRYGVKGRVLFLDLDVVILKNIDDFFSIDGDFLIIKDWNLDGSIGNSSVFRFESGQHHDIIEQFNQEHDSIRRRFRNEQAFLSAWINDQGRLDYWPDSWCPSFKANCIPRFPKNLYQAPEPPPAARIVIFHGNPNPDAALEGKSGKWYRYFKPARWIVEYWR